MYMYMYFFLQELTQAKERFALAEEKAYQVINCISLGIAPFNNIISSHASIVNVTVQVFVLASSPDKASSGQ